jgi:hypothetical protein
MIYNTTPFLVYYFRDLFQMSKNVNVGVCFSDITYLPRNREAVYLLGNIKIFNEYYDIMTTLLTYSSDLLLLLLSF